LKNYCYYLFIIFANNSLRKILRFIKNFLPDFLPIPYLYKFNLKILILPKHHWTQYLQGAYEPETFIKIRDIFEKNQIKSFWDIGANAGMYTIFIAKRYSCQINSFEPSKKYHKFLKLNTSFYKKIKVHNFGIGSSYKKESLIITDEPGSNYISKNKLDMDEKESEICEIRSVKNLSKIKPPNLAKIDVEGFEYEILNSSIDFFKKNKTILILEIDEEHLKRNLKEKKDIINLLKINNYIVERIYKSNNYICILS